MTAGLLHLVDPLCVCYLQGISTSPMTITIASHMWARQPLSPQASLVGAQWTSPKLLSSRLSLRGHTYCTQQCCLPPCAPLGKPR